MDCRLNTYNKQKRNATYFRSVLKKYKPLFVIFVVLHHEQIRARHVMKVLMYLSSLLLTIQCIFFVLNISIFHWWKDRKVYYLYSPDNQSGPESLFSPVWLLGFLISLSLLVLIILIIAHCTSLKQYFTSFLFHLQRCVFVSSRYEPDTSDYDSRLSTHPKGCDSSSPFGLVFSRNLVSLCNWVPSSISLLFHCYWMYRNHYAYHASELVDSSTDISASKGTETNNPSLCIQDYECSLYIMEHIRFGY